MGGYKSVREDFNWFKCFKEELCLSQSTVDEAEDMFLNDVKSRTRESDLILIAVSTYIVARENKETRSIRQFSKVISSKIFKKRMDDTSKKIRQNYNKIRNKLDLNMRNPHPKEQIEYISSELGMENDSKETSEVLCESIADLQMFTGRSPASIAASAVYATTDYGIEEVSDATGTGKSSIQNVIESLKEEKGEEWIDEKKG